MNGGTEERRKGRTKKRRTKKEREERKKKREQANDLSKNNKKIRMKLSEGKTFSNCCRRAPLQLFRSPLFFITEERNSFRVKQRK